MKKVITVAVALAFVIGAAHLSAQTPAPAAKPEAVKAEAAKAPEAAKTVAKTEATKAPEAAKTEATKAPEAAKTAVKAEATKTPEATKVADKTVEKAAPKTAEEICKAKNLTGDALKKCVEEEGKKVTK